MSVSLTNGNTDMERLRDFTERGQMADALLQRGGVLPLNLDAPYRELRLVDMARRLAGGGIPAAVRDSDLQVLGCALAQSTSDFPELLTATANKAAMLGYTATFEDLRWCSTGFVASFRTEERVGVNAFPRLPKVPEGGEYKTAILTARKATIQVASYGLNFGVTRQAMLADSTREFTVIPQAAGAAAKRTVADAAFTVLTGNPTLTDGVALFHSSHANVQAFAAISSASISAAAKLMAAQADDQGVVLGLRPKYLLCSIESEGLARATVSSHYFSGPAGYDLTKPNTSPQLEVVADPRIASTQWFLSLIHI